MLDALYTDWLRYWYAYYFETICFAGGVIFLALMDLVQDHPINGYFCRKHPRCFVLNSPSTVVTVMFVIDNAKTSGFYLGNILPIKWRRRGGAAASPVSGRSDCRGLRRTDSAQGRSCMK